MVELGLLAEKEGFDYCWVSHDVFMRSSLVTLTAIGLQSKRIMLGNTILNPYTLNPSEIAMYLCTLDELTNGRVVFGISAGALEYMDWLGIEHKRPLTRTKECVKLVRELVSGKVVKHDGEEFSWGEQCYMRFKPFRPKIPVYIGGQGDRMLEYSGGNGDGALPLLYPPEFASYAVSKIREGAIKTGRDPSEVDVAGCVWISVADEAQDAVTDGLKELVAYFGPLLGVKGLAAVGLTHQYFAELHQTFKEKGIKEASKLVDEKMLRLAIYGTPDECIGRVEKLAQAGVNQVLFGAPLGPNPREAIRVIGRKIIPYFKDTR
ncbi:MAG: LLM class flavin-dependent oxidoreductase [Thermoprotei archaeon]